MHTRDSPSLAAGAHGSTYGRLPPKGAAGSPRTAGLAGLPGASHLLVIRDLAIYDRGARNKYHSKGLGFLI